MSMNLPCAVPFSYLCVMSARVLIFLKELRDSPAWIMAGRFPPLLNCC